MIQPFHVADQVLDSYRRYVDACLRDDRPGVKAVVIYPMNALANDQLNRFRRLLGPQPAVSFGRYPATCPSCSTTTARGFAGPPSTRSIARRLRVPFVVPPLPPRLLEPAMARAVRPVGHARPTPPDRRRGVVDCGRGGGGGGGGGGRRRRRRRRRRPLRLVPGGRVPSAARSRRTAGTTSSSSSPTEMWSNDSLRSSARSISRLTHPRPRAPRRLGSIS